ncbi:MAG: hypothetical protein EBX59_03605 [Betaproteobacteria bacterium]|nr:hypothetical protein [Betaproteobacteria bacterium]
MSVKPARIFSRYSKNYTITKPSAQDMRQWESLAEQLYPRIRGKLVPSELFDEVMAQVKAFRAQRR